MNPWTLSLEAIGRHEYWRLWTAHFCHYNWTHLVVNLACMVPPLLAMPRRMRRALPLWLLMVLPLIGLVLLWVPGLEYRGAGGCTAALWGLAGAVLVRLGRREDRIWGTLIIALLVVTLSSEAYGIRLPEPGAALRNVPLAHQAGALLGLLSGLFWPRTWLFKTQALTRTNP